MSQVFNPHSKTINVAVKLQTLWNFERLPTTSRVSIHCRLDELPPSVVTRLLPFCENMTSFQVLSLYIVIKAGFKAPCPFPPLLMAMSFVCLLGHKTAEHHNILMPVGLCTRHSRVVLTSRSGFLCCCCQLRYLSDA
jgi:hypothetical protein